MSGTSADTMSIYETDTTWREPADDAGPRGFRLPHVGILAALARHPFLAALPVALLVAAAAFLGVTRTPVYTAQATLQVGRFDVSSPGALASFSTATQSLASAYARAVQADAVVVPVARQMQVAPGKVRGHLRASPVPDSPLFRIEATASDERTATVMANTASRQLLDYVRQVNTADPDGQRLYGEYQHVQRKVTQQKDQVSEARAAYQASGSDTDLARLHDEQARRDALGLRLEAAQQAYMTSQQGRAISADAGVLVAATGATSDRTSRLELLVFLGVLAGVAVGLALATLRANLIVRRKLLQ